MSDGMKAKHIKLKGGELVVLHNKLCGGVSYKRENITELDSEEADQENSEWETKKTIFNVRERKEGTTLYNRIQTAINKICGCTPFGFIVAREDKAELEAKVNELKEEVAAFNARSQYVSVEFRILFFDLSGNDTVMAKEIEKSVVSLTTELLKALDTRNPKYIREVITKAKNLNGLERVLESNEGIVLKRAVKKAREVATKISKAAKSTETDVNTALKSVDMSAINAARMVFLEKQEPQQEVAMASAAAGRFD